MVVANSSLHCICTMVVGLTTRVLLCSLLVGIVVANDSCSGRCGQNLDSAFDCQCNSHCENYNDCCADYRPLCLGESCSGRCGSHDNTKPCQCNSACANYGDCCADYNTLCGSGGGGGSPLTLSQTIQNMWTADHDRFPAADCRVSTNGNKLFDHVNEARLHAGVTFSAFMHLLDNYETMIGTAESQTTHELHEIDHFLDVIMRTDVMSYVYTHLDLSGRVSSPEEFRSMFQELWFNLYPRSSSGGSPLDSSGFEHVLVGETKSTSVSGFHSWIQFYLEEKKGSLHYNHMVAQGQPDIYGAHFHWNGKLKSMGSFFLGTSPEFELGVYTLCAVLHTNARCNFQLEGHAVSIQTYDINHKAGNQIGSAYPAI